jgi:hypothetical protein
LRRFLATAAFVALAAGLLVPSMASAAAERTLTAGVFGTGPGGSRNAGTARVPKPVSLSVNLFTHDAPPPNPFTPGSTAWLRFGRIPNGGYRDQIFLPRTIQLNDANFPGCSQTTPVINPANCPPRSRLGQGQAFAQIKGCSDDNRPASNPIREEAVTITLYKGSIRNTLVAHLRALAPVPVNQTILIRLANVPRAFRGLYGKAFIFQVSDGLIAQGNRPGDRQGVCITLRIVRITVNKVFVLQRVSLGRGRFVTVRRYIAQSNGCLRRTSPPPARNVYPFRNFVQFTDGFFFGPGNWRIVSSDVALASPNCRV